MPTTCFVSYEIHPITRGGCGVLIHHAARILLERGHDVVFLLEMPRGEFLQFRDRSRLELPRADHCRVYLVEDLCSDLKLTAEDIPNLYQRNSVRFAHALRRLQTRETIDLVEFPEYCGMGYYAFAERLFAKSPARSVLAARLHSSIELLDDYAGTNIMDLDRHQMFGQERAGLSLAEAILTPTQTFFRAHYQQRYGLDPGRVVVAQSPKEPFPRVARRPSARGPFRIAFIGRMFQLKGVDQLVLAVAILLQRRPQLDCTVDLIGYDGRESPFGASYSEYLKTLVPAALRDRFVFHGQVPHAQLVEHLNQALFAVFPNRIESFCYALHETYDAGVPVIVNHLPAFADFFENERNALVYDGTTDALVAAMEQLIDDQDLCHRLCRPYPVAETPLGTYYDQPRALAPLAAPAAGAMIPLVIVLCESLAGASQTLADLAAQTHREHQVVCLVAAQPDEEQTLWWLGRPWHVRAASGAPIGVTNVQTSDALVVLNAGDRPAPEWLETCVRALVRRPALGFSGTWVRREGRTSASDLDIAPEIFPFLRSAQRTHALIRTAPRRLLIDLFDPNLGDLGEIGCLWHAIECKGPGCLSPEPLLDAAPMPDRPLNLSFLHYLLARYSGPFAGRLARFAGMLHGRALSLESSEQAQATIHPAMTVEQKLRTAAELGGSDLMKIALRKLASRAGRR